ncbi:MAG: hypothetical protein RBT80_24865 [Candidatus Vecturithrix sp.]|jgi:hypothetical protein|nr:hypothetical protein [Candidatus Vecturithrix sp.]
MAEKAYMQNTRALSNRAAMLETPIPRLVARMSLPTMIAMTLNGLYYLVNAAFVGYTAGLHDRAESNMRRFRHKSNLIPIVVGLLFLSVAANAQSLFESAVTGTETQETALYHLNGYFRSGIFANDQEFRDRYAEGALKLDMTGNRYGNAFAEVRYRASSGDDDHDTFTLREGYVNLILGKFDFRVGQQIIVWGRADGFNPTNNLTPTDFTIFSPDEDDKRLASFVAKGVYHVYPFKIEFDWVPVYVSSELPFENAALPDGVAWTDEGELDQEWDKSSFGVKVDLEKPAFDGSVSYFNGYHKLPGIRSAISDSMIGVYTQAYRTQVWGADFSTTIDRYGLRGEFAYSRPDKENDRLYSVPCQQLEYTFGLDLEWKDLSLIVQYIGKYIIDFDSGSNATDALTTEISQWNQMILAQQERWNHSASVRPSISFLHETLKAELLGLVNFNTEEVFLQPKVTYDITDAFALSVGAQVFYGPDDTLYGYMEKNKNACFVELKNFF